MLVMFNILCPCYVGLPLGIKLMPWFLTLSFVLPGSIVTRGDSKLLLVINESRNALSFEEPT